MRLSSPKSLTISNGQQCWMYRESMIPSIVSRPLKARGRFSAWVSDSLRISSPSTPEASLCFTGLVFALTLLDHPPLKGVKSMYSKNASKEARMQMLPTCSTLCCKYEVNVIKRKIIPGRKGFIWTSITKFKSKAPTFRNKYQKIRYRIAYTFQQL